MLSRRFKSSKASPSPSPSASPSASPSTKRFSFGGSKSVQARSAPPPAKPDMHPLAPAKQPDDVAASPTALERTAADWRQRAERLASTGSSSPDLSSTPDEDDDSRGSVPPSMTTGSTSASTDSLEGVADVQKRPPLTLKGDDASRDQGDVVPAASSATELVLKVSEPQSTSLLHSEFGICNNTAYRYVSSFRKGHALPAPVEEEPSYFVVLTTYISYLVLIVIGHMRDFFGKRLYPKAYAHLVENNGYAALNSDFDSFYTRRLKERLDDCFSRPVTGVCGRTVVTLDRRSDDFNHTFKLTGGQTRALNVSAYNYLGFAQSHGGCADTVEDCLRQYSVSSFGSRLGAGSLDLQAQAEKLVARFVGKEDAMICSMGFATNSTTIPALAGPGTLIISDEYNHTSIRFGVRLSGAHIRSFKHNDMHELEELLRECISQGMPRTHRPWKKIILIVEGLYSMEGTLVNLPAILKLKEKYKFYLYVDEAHSIGALGPNGRGVCDYFGIDPSRIDILMGTFTKSFGAAGGYISASKPIIDRIRLTNHANVHGETLAPPVLTQIIASMASIMGVGRNADDKALLPPWVKLPARLLDGSEGTERLRRLAFNARYLSSGLRKLGFIVYGHRDSPIVPLMIFQPAKMPLFSRMMLDRSRSLPPWQRFAKDQQDLTDEDRAALNDPANPAAGADGLVPRPPIVVVVVAYPATPLISSRVRFCVSASHTKSDIDIVLRACSEVGDVLNMKMGSGGPGGRWNIDQVVSRCLDLVEWNGEDAI